MNPMLIVKITYCVTYSFIRFPKDNKLQGASALPSHSSWRFSQCFSPNLNIRAHTMSSTRQADNMNKSKAKVTQNHVKRQEADQKKLEKLEIVWKTGRCIELIGCRHCIKSSSTVVAVLLLFLSFYKSNIHLAHTDRLNLTSVYCNMWDFFFSLRLLDCGLITPEPKHDLNSGG